MKERRAVNLILAAVAAAFIAGCSGAGVYLPPDWYAIIADYRDTSRTVSFLRLAELNMALAETGGLSDKAFTYTQAGPGGLVPEWGQNPAAGALLSDIFFSMGHIALAQRYAFETLVQDNPEYNGRMLARLVETNLIYGDHRVAEKYLLRLEKYDGWKSWARKHRDFLGDDAMVGADSVLGPKRKCLPQTDFLSTTRNLDLELKDIVRAAPEHTETMDYLGVLYLLECDFDSFKEMLDEFYGTEALKRLPVSFSEAACMMSELYPGYWKTVGVDVGIYRRYVDFKKRLESGQFPEKYQKTYWYYVMQVNGQQ